VYSGSGLCILYILSSFSLIFNFCALIVLICFAVENFCIFLTWLKITIKATLWQFVIESLQLRYDNEMQHYLIANGLQASDVSKSKRKKESKEKAPAAASTTSSAAAATQPLVTLTPEQMAEEMARTILESAGICADPATLSTLAGDTSLGDEQLPSFSQVWSAADTIAPAQLCLSAGQSYCGTGTAVPPSSVPVATSQPAALCRSVF